MSYIRALPYTISLPLHHSIVVHAGLVPGVPLEDQRREDMVAMRNLSRSGDGSFTAHEKDADGARAWAGVWPGPERIIFGHDAKRGLQQFPHATGLDTGCLCAHLVPFCCNGRPQTHMLRVVWGRWARADGGCA